MQATADASDLTPEAPVIADVVTYQRADTLRENLRPLVHEVAHVVVVDNASANFGATGCTLIRNRINTGVTQALNQRLNAARKLGCAWVATFDQYSLVSALRQRHPMHAHMGVLVTSHRNCVTGTDDLASQNIGAPGDGWQLLRARITSGGTISTQVLEKAGSLDEELFIDFYAGTPGRRIKDRKRDLLELERQCRASTSD